MIIKTSQIQFDYLINNLNNNLKEIFLTSISQTHNQYNVDLDRDTLDAFRDWAIEELQKKRI